MDLKPETLANAAIFFHPDAAEAGWLTGAGTTGARCGFIESYVRHSEVPSFYGHCARKAHFETFCRRVVAVDTEDRPCGWIPLSDQDGLAEVGCLWLPRPDLDGAAWQRRAVGTSLYSLCGVVHTVASDRIMDRLGGLLISPVQPWDALVCTSRPLRATVSRLLDNWAEFLNQRTGGRVRIGVQIPVIPPGVDCQAHTRDAGAGAAFRERLGIGEDEVVVLSPDAPGLRPGGDPLPLYRAVEETSRRTARPILLVQLAMGAGADGDAEVARQFCPSVRTLFVDGRDDAARGGAWGAADIFGSLADGAPDGGRPWVIEAMAAGLPAVVADRGGNRDWLRHGTDGFVIPTWMPPAGAGRGLELPIAGDLGRVDRDHARTLYRGYVNQATAVDVAAGAEAFAALADDPDLRARMGTAAHARAWDTFDWRFVIASYQALWEELTVIRETAAELAPRSEGRPIHPLRDDPFALLAGSAGRQGGGTGAIVEADDAAAGLLDVLRSVGAGSASSSVMLPDSEIDVLLARLPEGGASLETAVDAMPEDGREAALRAIGWLGRSGVVRIRPAAADGSAAAEAETPETLVAMADAARERDDHQAAVALLKKALVQHPEDTDILMALGRAHSGMNDWDAAAASFRQAVRLGPGNVVARRDLARALFGGGDAEAAGSELMRALRLAPEDRELWYWLGVILHHEEAFDAALECFAKSREWGGETADLLYQVGLVHESLGDTEAATRAFADALRLQSDLADAVGRAAMRDEDMART